MTSQSQNSTFKTFQNKPTRKNKRVFVCAFPSCGYHTSSIKTLKIHDDIHSLGCGCYVSDKNNSSHQCKSNCQKDVNNPVLPFNPSNVDLGIFTRQAQAFGGTLSEFSHAPRASIFRSAVG